MKGLSIVSLSTVLHSVRTLHIKMEFKLDEVIGLMHCFPSLQNLFIKVMISHTMKAHTIHTVLELTVQLLFRQTLFRP